MAGTGDAGVVVADGLLAVPLQFFVRHPDVGLDETPQVTLDGRLVDRGRRNDLHVADDAALVDRVAVVADPARGLGTAVPGRGPGLDLDARRVRLFILLDDADRFFKGVKHLDPAHQDALERVKTGR